MRCRRQSAGGTDFGAAVSEAAAFFAGAGSKRRILIFVTDGEPSPVASLDAAKATLAGIDVFAFNIALSDTQYTIQLDNTPVDGVPVVPPGDADALVPSLRAAFGAGPDMNPAHIVRECLTNADWGLGHGEADIGPSFTAAADRLLSEGFGLSLLWQQESSIEDFLAEVLNRLRIGGANFDAAGLSPAGATIEALSSEWATNPATGLPWTWNDLAALEIGFAGAT